MSEPVLLRALNASAWTGPTGNNTWLLRGRVPALVDAGVGNPAHVEAVAAALQGQPLARVLITHGHGDHISGVPVLQARWPALEIMAALKGRATRLCETGESLAAGDSELAVIATPGHSPDHICFFDERSGDLFCGDMVRLGGTIVIPASKGGNLRQYLQSLRRIRDLAPRRLLPGHGPIVDDPRALIDEYVRHREERERQVVEAVRDGLTTAQEIALRIYGRLPEPLLSAAADSVQAHLNKLNDQK